MPRERTYNPHDTWLDRVLWSPIVTVLNWVSEHVHRLI